MNPDSSTTELEQILDENYNSLLEEFDYAQAIQQLESLIKHRVEAAEARARSAKHLSVRISEIQLLVAKTPVQAKESWEHWVFRLDEYLAMRLKHLRAERRANSLEAERQRIQQNPALKGEK